MGSSRTVSENQLVLLLSAVQFVNVLDFVMVLPLGPDFVEALGMPPSALGLVGGSYTAAAALGGLIGAAFLDRFDRRQALAVTVAGLVIATAAGGFAFDLYSLLAARIAAGALGGPATALCLAMIADTVPLERRGRAMGTFMSSFSVASVIGVPAGLELARISSWRLPFFAVAALGLLIVPLAYRLLPPMREHLERAQGPRPSLATLLRPTVLLSLSAIGFAMLGTFMLVPHVSSFAQLNLGLPRDDIKWLYLIGGAVSFLTVRIAGRLTDRYGPLPVASGAIAVFASVIYLSFVRPSHAAPAIVLLFSAFMVSSTFRFVPMQALSSRVPTLHERARFMSLQSTVQHAGSALGSMLSSLMLGTDSHGALTGMETVGWLAIGITLTLPFVLHALHARLGAPPPTLPQVQAA